MPPCEYRTVSLSMYGRKRLREKRRRKADQKKKALLTALSALGYELVIQKQDKNRILIVGSGKSGKNQKIEILFDESDGKFVSHFTGVPTHNEEHEMFDKLIAKLKELGFESEISDYSDKPKLPQREEDPPQSRREEEKNDE